MQPVEQSLIQSILARRVIGRLSLQGVLALAGIAGPIMLLVADIIAGQSADKYNIVRDAISSLAWTRLGWVQTVGFLAIGLMVEIFTAGLFLSIRGRKWFGLGIFLLVLFGFGLLLVGAFHTDMGRRPTIDGTIHELAANTIFWILPVSILLICQTLKRDPFWDSLYLYSMITAIFALLWCAYYKFFLPETFSWFGLYERILVFDEVIWIQVMGWRLLRLSWLRTTKLLKPSTAVID